MRDRPLLRLSRLLSMDSHPSLPRPSVCGSLEPTTLLMKPVAWFSTCVFPSRGVICAFSQQCSPYSDVFCPTRSMALLTFPLFLPLLPLACYQGERTCLSFSARLLSSRCASRGTLCSKENRILTPYRINHIHSLHEPCLLLVLV